MSPTPPTARRFGGSLLIGVGLAVGGLLVSLGFGEAVLRLYAVRHRPIVKTFFWIPQPEYGWGLAPRREGPYFDDHGEFRADVRINSLGQRDVEHEYRKPPGMYRILILGDSYMEAVQLDSEHMFARLLEQRLNAASAQPVEVINTGVSAWGTDNELLFFRAEGYKYQPDLVLLMFTTCNDVRENYEPFNRMAASPNLAKPHFELRSDGSLQILPGEPSPPGLPWWQEYSYVARFLHQRLGTVNLPGPHAPPWIAPDPHLSAIPADMLVYKPETPPEVKEAWRVTEALIRTLRTEVEQRGAKLAVVVHNGPWVYYQQRWDFMFMHDHAASLTWDRQKPNRRMGMFLSAEKIPYTDLLYAFEAAKDRDPLFFKIDPHWTAAGHALAAQTAAEFLIARGLIPGAGAGH